MTEFLLKWIRPEIRALSAYQVAGADGMVKLYAMENPYALPQAHRDDWVNKVAAAEINRYPDAGARELKAVIKSLMQPPAGSAMLLGNGSDEIIQMLALAVAQPGRCIMAFEPGFVMYRMIAEFTGMQYVGVPLDDNFEIDVVKTLRLIDQHQPAIIFIAYPNNPTANCFQRAAIDQLIQFAPGLVVIDEAYHPFAQDSYMDALVQHEKLLVMRTVSKMGLAGLRLGVLFGHPLLINEIDKLRLPYNINVLTQQAASAILRQPQALEQQAAAIREQRTAMLRQLAGLPQLTVYPSQANFILFRLHGVSADTVFNSLKQQGVLIKNMSAAGGALDNCLRVTVGMEEENAVFMRALLKAVNSE